MSGLATAMTALARQQGPAAQRGIDLTYGAGRAFAPGNPLPPIQGGRNGVHLWEYIQTRNSVITPRVDDGLLPFPQLKNLVEFYDVAAVCVSKRCEEMRGLDWAIVPKDVSKMQEYRAQIKQATDFFQMPDGYHTFRTWMVLILKQILVYDALAIFPHPSIAADLDGDYSVNNGISSLDVIDGSTIKVLVDLQGRPSGFQSVAYGVPLLDFSRPNTTPALPGMSVQVNDLLYMPYDPDADRVYGSPPAEKIINRIKLATRKLASDLEWYQSGSIPDVLIGVSGISPDALQEYEDMFNALLAGNDVTKHQAKFIPTGDKGTMTVQQLKPYSWNHDLETWMMTITTGAYGLNPSALGFTEKSNKASAGHQENAEYRMGILPLAEYLKDLFDIILQKYLGYTELQWAWPSLGEQEDKLVQAQVDQIYYNIGLWKRNELRALRLGAEVTGAIEEEGEGATEGLSPAPVQPPNPTTPTPPGTPTSFTPHPPAAPPLSNPTALTPPRNEASSNA